MPLRAPMVRCEFPAETDLVRLNKGTFGLGSGGFVVSSLRSRSCKKSRFSGLNLGLKFLILCSSPLSSQR